MSMQVNSVAIADRTGLAAYVKFQREQLKWKRELLAPMAGVSLSTIDRIERIERVECGEPVRPAAPQSVAGALGLERDAFTRPRPELNEREQADWLDRMRIWLETHVPVKVALLRNEAQLRSLAETQFVVFDGDLGEAAADDLGELRDCLDLAGFILGTVDGTISPPPERGFRMRTLYADIFAHVLEMERRHEAVCLVGTYTAETDIEYLSKAHVGVLALRSKRYNPAAIKGDTLFAERRIDRGSVAWDR
ncbi:XRE family transcriptional regulator [Sphingomonas sp. LB3N6]|uniref:XRE family transcriptional regulator n=1 Tax=Sphingomonas fucosidasi TaxID=3096164 RepID=UPI002FC89D15